MEVISGDGRMGGKVHGIKSIIGGSKIDRGRGGVKTVQEMEKPKNLYVRPVDMN